MANGEWRMANGEWRVTVVKRSRGQEVKGEGGGEGEDGDEGEPVL